MFPAARLPAKTHNPKSNLFALYKGEEVVPYLIRSEIMEQWLRLDDRPTEVRTRDPGPRLIYWPLLEQELSHGWVFSQADCTVVGV